MNRDTIFVFIAGIIYLAILYMLVRPGSKGTDLVKTVSGALADLVRGTVGYSYNPKSGWQAP